jgi:hypothetical protein
MPRIVIDINAKIYIRANRLKKSSRDIGKFLGCTPGPVQRYMRNAGLTISIELANKFRGDALRGGTIMTIEQDIYIKKNYLKVPVKRMAKNLGRSGTLIRTRMRQLRLEVPKELAQKRKMTNQFPKGQVPYNKGKKQVDFMSKEAIAKTKKTRFKQGRSPHNELYNGAIRNRKDIKTGITYRYIRISKGEWQLLHRYVYEKKFGPIPEGCLIIFKDGDQNNCNLENLRCITFSENGERVASKIHARPPELKKAIRLKNKLIKTIKHHEK